MASSRQFARSLLARAGAAATPRSAANRAVPLRGGDGGHPGGWWGPGTKDATGYLFGEVPPPPGQSRKWEDWEAPYYATMAATALILGVGLSAKPDTSGVGWAREEALRRLQQEEQA